MYWRPGRLHLSRDRVGGHRDDLELAPSSATYPPSTNPFLGFFPTFELAVHPPPTPGQLPLRAPEPTTRRSHHYRRWFSAPNLTPPWIPEELLLLLLQPLLQPLLAQRGS